MTDNTPLIQVLGAIAYGELKAYDGAKAEAEGAPTEEERRWHLRSPPKSCGITRDL